MKIKEICKNLNLPLSFDSQISRIANGKIYIKHKNLFIKRKPVKDYKPSTVTKLIMSNKAKKLKESDVFEIKELYKKGKTQIEIAKLYNVSNGTISNVIKNKYYKNGL